MSEENVEVVRAAFEAWNASDMEGLAALYDPDIVVRIPEEWPEPGPLIGREPVIRQFRRVREAWDFDELVPVAEPIDAGDRVLVRAAWRGVGRGPRLATEWTFVYTLRRDRVILLEFFSDHGEALETVGLN